MLSICITSRNVLLEKILVRLNEQSNAIDVPTEICIFENTTSTQIQKTNQATAEKLNNRYFYEKKYLSYNQMKNSLANSAKGSYLLFLNGDVHVTHRNFLIFFIEVMQPGVIVHGGVTATGKKPDQKFILHWKAMHNMLTYHSDERNIHPYFHLHTNNIMGPRGLFLQFPFPKTDEISSLLPYSFKLKNNKIPVIHIDNPVAISKLLSNKRFLAASQNQMRQTAIWLKNKTKEEIAQTNIAEYTHLSKLKKFKLYHLFMLGYKINTHLLVYNISRKQNIKLCLYRNFRRKMLGKFLKLT